MSRRPPDCVPACCKYCTVWSLLIFTQGVRFYRTSAFSHEYNARYGNSVRLFVRLSVLDTLVLWQNG